MRGAFWLLSLGDELVGNNLLIHHLLHQSQLLSHAHNYNNLLHHSDLKQTQPNNNLKTNALNKEHLNKLTSKVLICETGLAHGLDAKLHQLYIHLLKNLVNLGQIVGTLDGNNDNLCTNNNLNVTHMAPPNTPQNLTHCPHPSDN